MLVLRLLLSLNNEARTSIVASKLLTCFESCCVSKGWIPRAYQKQLVSIVLIVYNSCRDRRSHESKFIYIYYFCTCNHIFRSIVFRGASLNAHVKRAKPRLSRRLHSPQKHNPALYHSVNTPLKALSNSSFSHSHLLNFDHSRPKERRTRNCTRVRERSGAIRDRSDG